MGLDLAEGVCLAGRFRLERCIGEGGMGVVWAATNTNTRRRVALKLLRPETAADKKVRRRFLREARAASAVRHANVVEILDVVELDDGAPAMVMELLEGEPLSHRLRRQGMLEVGEAASILLPAMSAVGAAHALGIVHRDLKPDNIFLAKRPGGGQTVKVLDFGIAKVTALDHEAGNTEALTGTGAMLGTPYYMSPEQVFADAVIDYRSDIWAFGVILYQCLTGVRPTQAENVGQIMKIIMTGAIIPLDKRREDLPSALVKVVGSMLSSERVSRPQSLREVCTVLAEYSDEAIASFGDPVFVNAVPTPSPSSGKDLRADSADHEPPTRDLTPTRSENRRALHPDGDVTARVDLAAATARAATPLEAEGVAAHTESRLGLSLSGHRAQASRRWPLLGGILVVVGMTGIAWRLLPQAPAPTPTPATPSVSPTPTLDARPTATPSATANMAAAAYPDASLPGVASSSLRARPEAVVQAPEPVVHVLKPRDPARATSPPLTATTPNDPRTVTPGGLIEKPPF